MLIEGVRCFATRQEVPLRPITVLVGENSTGKSTFLALTRIAWNLGQGQLQIDFNEEPFLLGAFDQVASAPSSKRARPKAFHLGFAASGSSRRGGRAQEVSVGATLSRRSLEPHVSSWSLQSSGLTCSVELPILAAKNTEVFLSSAGEHHRFLAPESVSRLLERGNIFALLNPFLIYLAAQDSSKTEVDSKAYRQVVSRAEEFLVGFRGIGSPRPVAFAPIRTHPLRTYDPLRETRKPEGSHVPVMLARLSASEPEEWKELIEALGRFGKASGLFSSLDVRRVGPEESDPFQIQVNVSGQPFNLVDVGYGVSQILPVVVDILRGPEHQMYLMQQPEVHLHPRAQAELATFLGSLVALQEKSFVVETHSDYLVDRLRMDVRDKRNLTADQVMILYFERQGSQVQIHPIEIDEQGNLVNVPPGYRSFFLEEDRRLLGIA